MSAQPIQMPRARILDVTEAQYHADPCAVPSLNQSTAHVLITKSPLHAYAQHPRLGAAPREMTTPQIEGTVIHALLLGKGASGIEVLNFDNYRTKVAQVVRDEVIAQGRTPVLVRKYDEIVTAAEIIRARLAEQGCVFEGGIPEIAIEWTEETDEGPVLCRGRLDYLILGERRAKIIDPKKITSADPITCARHADDYGHHIQAAAYTSAVEKLRPDLEGRVDFEFAFHELEAPHAALPRSPGPTSRWVGERQWQRACLIWKRCMNTGVWPSYPIEPLDVTPWTDKREQELAEQELLDSSN